MHNDGTTHDNFGNKTADLVPPAPFDPEKYRHYIDDYDLTYEQQIELLRIIAEIMRQFIDLGFNIHPIQCAQGTDQNTVDVVGLLEHLWETDVSIEKGDA